MSRGFNLWMLLSCLLFKISHPVLAAQKGSWLLLLLLLSAAGNQMKIYGEPQNIDGEPRNIDSPQLNRSMFTKHRTNALRFPLACE